MVPGEEVGSAASENELIIENLQQAIGASENRDLGDYVKTRSTTDLENDWRSLSDIVRQFLLIEDNDARNGKNATDCFSLALSLSYSCLELDDWIVPDDMYQILILLHDYFVSSQSASRDLLSKCSRVCEVWFHKDLKNKENLIKLPCEFLMNACLQRPTNELVKRLYKIRTGLQTFVFSQQSTVWDLIINLITQTTILKYSKGEKFLVYLMSSYLTLVKRIHAAVRQALLKCNKMLARKYADICYTAYIETENLEIRKAIELDCIQDLCYNFLLLPPRNKLFLNHTAWQFVHGIHSHRGRKLTDGLYKRVYRPFLWRMLESVNADVRVNAAKILFDVFPLIDSSDSQQIQNEDIQNQFNIFFNLMEDEDHVVRSLSSVGICTIISRFYSRIPPMVIDDTLKIVCTQLAWDKSDPNVRLSVVKGITILLDNHEFHSQLYKLLPGLSDMLHDKSESVRIHFIKLLVKLKHIRTFKVWKIVERDQVFARLEIDSPSVCKQLVKLVMSSFISEDLMENNQKYLERAFLLIEKNLTLTRRFYQHFSKLITNQQAVQYIMIIRKCLMLCVDRYKTTEENRRPSLCSTLSQLTQTLNTTNASSYNTTQFNQLEKQMADFTVKETMGGEINEDELSVDNHVIIRGLMEIICVIWSSIRQQLQKTANKELREVLNLKMSKAVEEFWNVFDDVHVQQCLILMAGFLSKPLKSLRNKTRTYALTALSTTLRNNDASSAQIGGLLVVLCQWNSINEICELMRKYGESLERNQRDKRVSKSAREPGDSRNNIQSLLRLIKAVLSQKSCVEALVKYSSKSLNVTLNQLANVMECIKDICSDKTPSIDVVYIPEILDTYIQLYITLNRDDNDSLVDLISELSNIFKITTSSLTNINQSQSHRKVRRILNSDSVTLEESRRDDTRVSPLTDHADLITDIVHHVGSAVLAVSAFISPTERCIRVYSEVLENLKLDISMESVESLTKLTKQILNSCTNLSVICRSEHRNTENLHRLINEVRGHINEVNGHMDQVEGQFENQDVQLIVEQAA